MISINELESPLLMYIPGNKCYEFEFQKKPALRASIRTHAQESAPNFIVTHRINLPLNFISFFLPMVCSVVHIHIVHKHSHKAVEIVKINSVTEFLMRQKKSLKTCNFNGHRFILPLKWVSPLIFMRSRMEAKGVDGQKYGILAQINSMDFFHTAFQ